VIQAILAGYSVTVRSTNTSLSEAADITGERNFRNASIDGGESPVWVISGSADHVDGLPRTRPVYLS